MNSSLKDYYIQIEQLYNESVKLLLALNKSLTSNSSEVDVQITNSDNTISTIKIPSFLYMDNKIEQLSTNFDVLFNMPKNGEAWFEKSQNMYKLNVVQSNVAPVSPIFDITNMHAGIKQNNILKDLVSPQTFLKINVNNIPDNITEIYMKKFIYYDSDIYEQLQNGSYETYDDYIAALYNLVKGVDYDEYESVINLPLRNNKLESEFKIMEIISQESNTLNENLIYTIKFDTIEYYNFEDKTINYSLKVGDFITLRDVYNIFKVIKIDTTDNIFAVTIEETNGHSFLQTTLENSNMVFELYNPEYQKYSYVEVPVEENQYITLFIATIHNNIRSKYSSPINVDLNSVYIYDENNNVIIDNVTNQKMTYMTYYNQYCKNIGDILEGLTNTIYPQFSNFTPRELQELQDSSLIKTYVSEALNNDVLKVVRVNDHIFNEKSSEEIVSLNSQKLSIQSQLNTLQNNIDDIYNQLTTTNFNEDVSVTQSSLKEKLDILYNERNTLNKQLISTVNEIDVLKGGVKSLATSKYRIRGILDTEPIESYIAENINYKCKIIGIDVEYRYKSINADTSNVISINANVFSEWNKFNTIDKERKLVFDNTTNTYKIDYVNYESTNNILSWKQIDIPITAGEDVIIRLRYKYSIGQPFMNFYSPWSDEFTIAFPLEYTNDNDVTNILVTNDNDVINAKFINTLISNGYEEHVNNKIIDGSQQYYHMPENIYSGFNTPENKLISLKDKLISMSLEIQELKSSYNLNKQKYKIYIEYDGKVVELFTHINNTININLYGTYNETSWIKKDINLIIRNTGEIPVNMYTLFSGQDEVKLMNYRPQFEGQLNPDPYAYVPISFDEEDDVTKIKAQTCNQWIYFRADNPYLSDSYFYATDFYSTDYISKSEQGLTLPKPEDDYIVPTRNIILYKYENIKLTGTETSYANFLNEQSNLTGAFFIPNLLSDTQLLCDNHDPRVYKEIPVGDSISVPLLLEYFVKSNSLSDFNVTKKLAFDIRPNVDSEIKHYSITVNIMSNMNNELNSFNNNSVNSDTTN